MSSGEAELVRPDLRVRSHVARSLGVALLSCLSIGVGAMIAAHALGAPAETTRTEAPREALVHVAPIVVMAPRPSTPNPAQAPAPARAPTPAPTEQPAPTSAQEPAPAPTEQPARRVRAAAPRVDPSCILADGARPSCSWDDGFPAVSTDGTLVATKVIPDDGGRGFPGLTIRFLDVATSTIVRDVVVLDPDEVSWDFYDEDLAQNDEPGARRRAQLLQVMKRRAAVAQKLLDDKGYRPLEHLGTSIQPAALEPAGTAPRGDRVYAEFDQQAVRAIDPATSTALWSHRFDVPAPAQPDPDADCGSSFELHSLSVWWDPEMRIVLGTSAYHTGGCLCPTLELEQVVRLP